MWSFVSSLAETTTRNASLSISLVEASEVKANIRLSILFLLKLNTSHNIDYV